MERTPLLQKKETLVQLGNIFNSIVNEQQWPGYSIGINDKEYNDFKSRQ